MARNQFNNARVLGWLSHHLDDCSDSLASTKVLVNSAAVWWFCTKLTPDERAQSLGEFVSENARQVQSSLNGDDPKSKRKSKKDHAD